MRSIVFDSHAILRFAQDEPGAERVEELLRAAENEEIRAFMSEINLGEVYYITRRRMGAEAARRFLEQLFTLRIERAPASWEAVVSASDIKAQHALSYADCFAAALALRHRASIVTGDPEFKKVQHMVEIDWI